MDLRSQATPVLDRLGRVGLLSLALFALLGSPAPVRSEASGQGRRELTEYEAKAVFLRQVTRYVTWPDSSFSGPGAPIVIGIVGHDPFGELLDQVVAGQESRGRSLEIRRLEATAPVDGCHVIFLSREETRRQAEILAEVADLPILTVGEGDRFLRQGGGIRLRILDERMRFEISLAATDRAGLKLSSYLLNLASEVQRTEDR